MERWDFVYSQQGMYYIYDLETFCNTIDKALHSLLPINKT